MSEQTLKALRLIAKCGQVSAGYFAVEMGYGNPANGGRFRMKGPTGAAVLKRLAKRGLVHVWDDWFENTGGYVTLAELTPATGVSGGEGRRGEGVMVDAATAMQLKHERLNNLRGVSKKVRATAEDWLNHGKVPLSACIFADDEGAVIFEWEEGGITYELTLSEEPTNEQ